ncbi:non-ribosomal peptide synthetase [Paenibacillus chitinolyticus]|uniref:non-ribosomal peptide synthetase n=1 Tax=Paenibacillus chitinolyticus TaxID=79263 RepID=UPI001C44CE01|nr:non-ribosomal peptide synthetase [Paenibacillus chitinolyticus]MBV6715103.1 amino acid adenylation domain-containing protein [Paenibacillus chitinolyticus]
MSKGLEIEKMSHLTPLQEGMLFHALMNPDSHAYLEQVSLSIRGDLDVQALERSFCLLVKRHETLRSNMYHKNVAKPRQIVFKEREASVFFEDLAVLPDSERNTELESLIQADKNRPFDISKELLVRLTVLRTSRQEYTLLFTFHHIIMDGWCIGIVLEELLSYYEAEKNGRQASLPEVRPYSLYVQWLQKQDQTAASDYWRALLEGVEEPSGLPGNTGISGGKGYLPSERKFTVGADTARQLRGIAERSGATISSLFLAAWALILGRYNRSEDVVFGTVVSGRPPEIEGIERMVGLFINTVPVRISLQSDNTFTGLLKEVQRQTVQSRAYDYYSLAEIQAQSALKQDLIGHIVVFENYPLQELIGQEDLENRLGFAITEAGLSEQTPYDFNIEVEDGDVLNITLSYNGHTYGEAEIMRIQGHLETVLGQASSQPEKIVSEFTLLSEPERKELAEVWSGTSASYPEGTFHELFEAQAVQTPDKTAVVYEETSLTYRELNERANVLARILRKQGVRPDSPAAVLLERSADMVTAVLAIQKAGGAYIPIDPTYPAERIAYMLRDSGARVLLTQAKLTDLLHGADYLGSILDIQGFLEAAENQGFVTPLKAGAKEAPDSGEEKAWLSGLNPEEAVSNLEPVNKPDDLAYVIYTSGTTGNAKGVMIEHRHYVNTSFGYRYGYRLGEFDVKLLQIASFSFDVFAGDLARTFVNGGTMVICPQEVRIDPSALASYLEKHRITVFESTPALILPLMEHVYDHGTDISAMKLLITSSDSCSVHDYRTLLSRFAGSMRIMNSYGVTEAAIDSSFYEEAADKLPESGNVPIGKPLGNHRFYIVDSALRPVPVGVAGELCIGGDSVARGYLNRPELTAEKFVPSPFAEGGRLYRTGDLARWMPDGSVDFIGRIDYQVKIRGYRIEPGEIESALLKLEGVAQAVVTDRTDSSGHKYLCAYVAGHADEAWLRKRLSAELPGYMVPAHIVRLESLPLTPNGKIDRKALPAPSGDPAPVSAYAAPRTLTEAQLAELWQEVLGVKTVGIDDSFFELGGHSLKAVLLIGRIAKQFSVEVPLREVFAHPTVRGLAPLIAGSEESAFVDIEPVGEKEYHPVSPAQKRLLIIDRLGDAESAYNMCAALEMTGPLDRERLDEAFRTMIGRHESLRTSFAVIDGAPVQRIHKTLDFRVSYRELDSDGHHEARAEAATALVSELTEEAEAVSGGVQVGAKQPDSVLESLIGPFIRPFNLEQAPLIRAELIKLEEGRHLLLADMHHIITDGISIEVFVEEFSRLYAGETLPPLRIQYKDFTAWQNGQIAQGAAEKQAAYWKELFGGGEDVPVLDMPADYIRPAIKSFEGDSLSCEIDSGLTADLHRLCAQTGTTLYMVLLAAFNTLLHRYTGQEDIVVGSPVAGRPHPDLETMLGMFVNTLPMRNFPSADKPFTHFLKEVKDRALHAYENQDIPFEEVVERLQLRRDVSRNPLFDVMFVLQNTGMNQFQFDGITFRPVEFEMGIAKFDLTLSVEEFPDRLGLSFEYAVKLFKRETIEKLSRHFLNILETVVRNPHVNLADIELLTETEKRRIIVEFNDTKAPFPEDKTIHGWIEEQAAEDPDRIAVVFGGNRLTYGELDERANRLARTLRAKGARPDGVVAILTERSAEMMIGLLAILKAGSAYLPVDPAHPRDRVGFMLDDSGARIVLTASKWAEQLPAGYECILLDEEKSYHEDFSPLSSEGAAGPGNLAYVIYTSGTTGNPKGVMIEHRALVNRIHWMQKKYPIGRDDVILQKTPYSFDVSVWELFWWGTQGARVVFLAPGGEKEPQLIVDEIKRSRVTTLHFVPSMLSVFLDHIEQNRQAGDLGSLRYVFASGEALQAQHANRFDRLIGTPGGAVLANLYGPTEATIDVTYFDCPSGQQLEQVPIGKPIDNTELFIVDAKHQIQPIGVPGELCIAGTGLARGYLNRSELTAEKFIPIPHRPEAKMYKTGDLARWLPDGSVEYIGRIDHQVKIRGYRIELGEIEARLLNRDEIKETIVMDRTDANGQKYLCAYLVCAEDAELTVSEIRGGLAERLPDYMIPAQFVFLDAMPLTSNGKINRRALPEPDGSVRLTADYVQPETEMEHTLAEIWQDVLGIKKVGVRDNFFELGGDSIKALQIAARLNGRGLKMELRDLFRHPQIELVIPYIQVVQRTIPQGIVQGQTELAPIQRRFFERHHTDLHHYNQAVMLKSKGRLNEEALRQTWDKLTLHHDALRTVFRPTEEGGVTAETRDWKEGEAYELLAYDLTLAREPGPEIGTLADKLQSGFALNRGPLVKLALFRTAESDHLLIVIHHLVVDGVSWRILLEDLETAYGQVLDGLAVSLPAKTDSYREWAARLAEYANSSRAQSELSYWSVVSSQIPDSLPYDNKAASDKVEDGRDFEIELDRDSTEKLLKHAQQAYNTEINDLLLTALGLSFQEWSGLSRIAVSIEGHGREEIMKDVDVSRTVGWFTVMYPFVLDMSGQGDLGHQIKLVKDGLRRVPNKGIGYGILRYLTEGIHLEELPFAFEEPQISFNYLGQFDGEGDGGARFGPSSHQTGDEIGGGSERPFAFDINGQVSDGVFRLTFNYNRHQYRDDTVEKLAGGFKKYLLELIRHCCEKETAEQSPTDFTYQNLSIGQFENMAAQLAGKLKL